MAVHGAAGIRAANEINSRLTIGRACAPTPDCVRLSLDINVGGGVAADNLRRQILGWVEQLRRIIAEYGR